MFKENDTYIDLIWVEGLQGSGGKDAKKNPKQPTKTNKQKTLKHGYLRWFFPLQKKKKWFMYLSGGKCNTAIRAL